MRGFGATACTFCILGILGVLGVLWASGCADPNGGEDQGLDGGADATSNKVCKDSKGDDDSDGISNGDEGCLTGRDTDKDKVPDWMDTDSDDDGIGDHLEKGDKTGAGKCKSTKAPNDSWPCDTDNDGIPDYRDLDSDNDGALDEDEDHNGDGALGCCLTTCNKTTGDQKKSCIIGKDGCGPGQKCASNLCTPAIDFKCSDGETSPVLKDTFGDGMIDSTRGTFICRDATEDKPGRKKVMLKLSPAAKGDWRLALEPTAKFGEVTISGAKSREAAAVIDLDGTGEEVAGFVLSMPTASNQLQLEVSNLLSWLNTSSLGAVSVIASGSEGKSHDKYDTVIGTTVDVTASTTKSVSDVRHAVMARLLNRQLSDFSGLPGSFGASTKTFVVRFTTLRRYVFKKDAKGKLVLDAKGNPVDDGDASKWRLMVIGAVASRAKYTDPKQQTGILVGDLSNGTALATASDTVSKECDVGIVGELPVADIIWIVDGSSSMSDNRKDVAANAASFFAQATASSLDFRMAVAPGCGYTQYQKFCKDRFLGPKEAATFSWCIDNPGINCECEAGLKSAEKVVKDSLPRKDTDPKKIRPEAKLVIIEVTDAVPKSLKTAMGSSLNTCTLDSSTAATLNTHISKYKDFFTGISFPGAQAVVYGIAGICNNTCSAEIGHGYMELVQHTGGQVSDICQKNLGTTLQVIIDSITANASPAVLESVPISTSLAVSVGGTVAKRSRINGFDYRSSSNALVFMGTKLKKGTQFIASYNRWTRQEFIK